MSEVVGHEDRTGFLTVLGIGAEKPLGDLFNLARELGEVVVVDAVGVEEREEVSLEERVSEEKPNVVLGNVPEDWVAILNGLVEVAEITAELEGSLFEVPIIKLRILSGELGHFLHKEFEDELEVLLVPLDRGKKLALPNQLEEILVAFGRRFACGEEAFALPLNYFYNNLPLNQTNF